jgi:DNA invertase Pin-like site-specific DNA recombinase
MVGMTAGKSEGFTMTVAAYIRVSTRRQNDDGQRAEIMKWLDANGIDPKKVEWYADKESGTTIKRPEFDRLQADIFHGKVKVVVLWKLDRLSRRLKDGVTTLADWSERGLRVVVVTQQLDFNGSVGRMIAALLLGLAEIENEFRRERQAAGIEQAKKKGKYKGRANGTLKGNPGRVVELRDKGLTAPEISTALGISLRTVWRYMGRGQNEPVKV